MAESFGENFPERDFRGINVSMEYPVSQEEYPSIWVDFDETGDIQIMGVNHHERTLPSATDGVTTRRLTRWSFTGQASFTMVALTSLERDRLFDQVVRVLAFGNHADSEVISTFRQYVENNEFIAINANFDSITPRGNAAAPGTPWGTDEIIYERSVNITVQGEFVSDGETMAMVPLREIDITALSVIDPVEAPLAALVDPTGRSEFDWQ